MPKVSVVIPIYGVEKYIERCIRNLFGQTLEDIEFIFVDDCSNDMSISILKQVLHEYPRRIHQVKILRHEINKGLPYARRTGIKAATGDYIIHCDSDDWVDKETYEIMYNIAKTYNADVVSCDYQYHTGERVIKIMREHVGENRDEFIKNLMTQKSHWVLWNKMFRRQIILEKIIYPTQNMGEDMAVVLQMAYYCNIIKHIQIPFYYYYSNDNSLTNVKDEKASLRRFEETYNNVQIVDAFYKTHKDYTKFKSSINWLKLICKLHLDVKTLYGKRMWRDTFPLVEWKCLFNTSLSRKQRFMVLKKIIKTSHAYLIR